MLGSGRYGTRDIAGAIKFYDAIAEDLGAKRIMDIPDGAVYQGAQGGIFIIGKPFEGEASVGNGAQIGFSAPSRAAVDAVHAKALSLGGKDEGKPGLRGPAEYGMYACYFRDLDGNKIIVNCVGPE